jgi:hypothetical protein
MDVSDIQRAEEERLETEAILNAPPAAESVDFQQKVEVMKEILSQTEQEELETEAIMNAPPAAESVDLPERIISTPSYVNEVDHGKIKIVSMMDLEPPAISEIDIATETKTEPYLVQKNAQYKDVEVLLDQNMLEEFIKNDNSNNTNNNINGNQGYQRYDEMETTSDIDDSTSTDETRNVYIPALNELQNPIMDELSKEELKDNGLH